MKPCECGCGNPAPLAPHNRRELGWIKGEPIRFIRGHQLRRYQGAFKGPLSYNWKGGRHQTPNGYIQVKAPGHPNANKRGFVTEHVLIASAILGRALPAGAVVHHINGQRNDNRAENLIICESVSYHRLLHVRIRAMEACGHPDWLVCMYCHQYGGPNELKRGRGRASWHPACSTRKARRARLEMTVQQAAQDATHKRSAA